MAIFSNLDRLKNYPTPTIVLPKQSIEQGVSEGLKKLRPTVEQGNAGNVFTSFGEKLSLEDRLKQIYQKTTRHLAQYFVTDLYTDYIKIKPVQPIEHTSPILISLPTQTINQGGTNPTIIRFIPNQGSVVLTLRSYDVLIKQGTTLSNGVYKSFITTNLSKPNNFYIAPGFGLIQVKLPRAIVNQGIGTDPVISIGSGLIILRQGVIKTPSGLTSIITITPSKLNLLTIPDIKVKAPAAISNEVPQGIVIKPFNNVDPNIGNKVVEIKTLRYTADRLLAAVTPRIKHGSEDPSNVGVEILGERPFTVGNSLYSDRTAARANQILLAGVDSNSVFSFFNTTKSGYMKYESFYRSATEAAQKLESGNMPQYHANKIDPATEKEKDVRSYNSLVDGTSPDEAEISNILQKYLRFPALRQGEVPTRTVKRSKDGNLITRIATIPKDYDQLMEQVSSEVTEGQIASQNGDSNLLQPNSEVVVKFTRISQNGNPTVSFSAFLQNISDSFNATFTDLKYVGKQDTFKLYSGTTRQLGLSIKAIAMGRDESRFTTSGINALELANKINKLLQICVVGEVADQTYTIGPVVKFSLEPINGKGGMYKNLVAVVNIIKVDTQPEENPWDVDNTLPMIYGISFDLTILSTKQGTPLNVDKTFIG